MKVCCITNDVEPLSINGQTHNDIACSVQNEALPNLLRLYEKYNVKATFYCLASFAEQYPNVVKQIHDAGHEVACHGYSHEKDKAFDVLSKQEQIEHLSKAKDIIEKITNESVVSFRAPALRVNRDTPFALITTGFKTDSSIAPHRLDMFMSLGSKTKLQWLRAPRAIYKTSDVNLARKGVSGLTEVPVSAFVLPYIGTLMRISPFLIKMVRFLLFFETNRHNNKVVTFLFHPSEAVEETDIEKAPVRRSKGVISHFFSDIVRTKLKSRNLGPESLDLLEKELVFWKQKGYTFKTVKELI